jgi:hypothetical protein
MTMETIDEIATGPRAQQAIASLDDIEPELLLFMRGTARWMDPWFPQRGLRGDPQRGEWTQDDGIKVYMRLCDELVDGKGIRMIRFYYAPVGSDDVHVVAIRLQVVGLVDAELELRCNFDADVNSLRGTSAVLSVAGVGHEQCLADFHRWFGQ